VDAAPVDAVPVDAGSQGIDVLFLLPSLGAGGAERVTINLANGLLRAGHAPALAVMDPTGPLDSAIDPGMPRLQLGHPRVRGALLPLLRLVRDMRPRVLFASQTNVNLLLCLLRPLLPATTRLVVREPLHRTTRFEGRSTRRVRVLQRLLYRRADLVIASSLLMADALRRSTGASVHVLPNPVDIEAIRATTHSAAPEPRVGDGRRFVFIGRFEAQKAIPDLLQAFASTAGPDDRLTLIGDGSQSQTLRAKVADLDLGARVHFLADRAAPWQHSANADLLVLPSTDEGMPNVALEALAVGTPVLATTDLRMLEELAAIAAPGAIRLVERDELASALAHTDVLTSAPRPSLLPDAHELRQVVARFAAAVGLAGDDHP